MHGSYSISNNGLHEENKLVLVIDHIILFCNPKVCFVSDAGNHNIKPYVNMEWTFA